jgi:O-antigen ligase
MPTTTQPQSFDESRLRPRVLGAGSAAAAGDVDLLTAYWGKRFAVVIVATWVFSTFLGFRWGLALLNVVGFAAAVTGLWRPGVGLLGIAMLCTMESVTAPFLLTGGILRWNTFNYWLVFVLVFFLPLVARRRDVHSGLLTLFTITLAVQLAVSPDPTEGVLQLLNVVTAFGLLVYFARVTGSSGIWFWLGIVSGLVGAGGGLVYLLQFSELPALNRNVWSLFPLNALVCTCLALHQTKSFRPQMVLALLGTVNALWVFLSASRGSLLVAAVCMTFMILQLRGRRRSLALGAAVLVGISILSLFPDFEQGAIARWEEFSDSRRSLSYRTNSRSDLARDGWQIFLENPLGVGTGGFSEVWETSGLFTGVSRFQQPDTAAAHSGWIKVLAENGVPGIVLLVAYVCSFAWIGWRRRSEGVLPLAVLTTVIFGVTLISFEFQFKAIWFAAAGTTILLDRSTVRDERRQLSSHLLGVRNTFVLASRR